MLQEMFGKLKPLPLTPDIFSVTILFCQGNRILESAFNVETYYVPELIEDTKSVQSIKD
jgi:hypothetical protein